MSVKVYIVTEGQTESNFVNKALGPYFSSRDITLIPCTLVTRNDKKAGRQYKGGIVNYVKAKNDIARCMAYSRKNREVYVSTFFDFYRLPNDFPGFDEAQKINNGEKTSPSRRILQCIPEYAKPVDGIAIAQKIGLDVLRQKCRHFNEWIGKLEGLNPADNHVAKIGK